MNMKANNSLVGGAADQQPPIHILYSLIQQHHSTPQTYTPWQIFHYAAVHMHGAYRGMEQSICMSVCHGSRSGPKSRTEVELNLNLNA